MLRNMLIAINVICKHGRLNGRLSFGGRKWGSRFSSLISAGVSSIGLGFALVSGPAAAGGRGSWVWHQTVVLDGWVGLMCGWGLPQHMACNCGLLDAEKGGSVMVLGWSYWGALTHFFSFKVESEAASVCLATQINSNTENPSRLKAFLFSGCNYLWLDMQNTFITHPTQYVSLYNLFPFDPFQIQSCVFIFQTHWPQLFGLETGGGGPSCGRTAGRRPAQ